MARRITPVILAGGKGSRLWPVSRGSLPKQFIDFSAEGLSTFQSTLKRTAGEMFERPIIMTSAECQGTVNRQLDALCICADIIIEPEQFGTAMAVALASHSVKAGNTDTLCLILASDHIIRDVKAFEADCRMAADLAAGKNIVVFGISPTCANSDYGYIAPGETLVEGRANTVHRFIEKPAADMAELLVQRGCLWNSGNLLFDPETMIGELETLSPDIAAFARPALKHACCEGETTILPQDCGGSPGAASIDCAVLEKTSRAVVIHASFDWADIGSWQSVYDTALKDDRGNVLEGPAHAIDTQDSLVISDGPTAAIVGLRDVAVVVAGDAVLVADRKQASRVKEISRRLQHTQPVDKGRVHRPWGWFERMGGGPNFQVKQICVRPGAALSLQMHRHRAEHWTIVQGVAAITTDNQTAVFEPGSNVYIPRECIHRLRNASDKELIVIEVQTGSYLGEDDIVRFEDLYDRV